MGGVEWAFVEEGEGALRKEEEAAEADMRGRSLAARKSGSREEELGSVMAADKGTLLLGKPRNWDVKSSY